MNLTQTLTVLESAAAMGNALDAHRAAWGSTDEAFALLRRAFSLLALERWADANRTFGHFLSDCFTNDERIACFLRYGAENHQDVAELARRGLGFAPYAGTEGSARAAGHARHRDVKGADASSIPDGEFIGLRVAGSKS